MIEDSKRIERLEKILRLLIAWSWVQLGSHAGQKLIDALESEDEKDWDMK